MHVCVVTNRPIVDDPRARVDVAALLRAGNTVSEVRVVSPSEPLAPDPIVSVPSRVPRGGGVIGNVLRRIQPPGWLQTDLERRVAKAAARTGATLFMPIPTNLIPAAARAASATGGAVMRTPAQPTAGPVDLIGLAPHRPDVNCPPAGLGIRHTPADASPPSRPQPGRWEGRRVVIAYRKTDSNPGKYLEAALRRSGAQVRLETARLDFDTVPHDTDFILFVEGPYPALTITGNTPDVPILFWFHHGEHHLHANLRLIDRYRADAVLQAHSWHLSHWVPAPVHRFPFGIPADLLAGGLPIADRPIDVALVGAKLWEGGPYGRRQRIVADLEAAFPADRLGFAENITADEMAELYDRARIVVNEGGTRHYPITMRVFEAIGARAVLLTDDLPGTDVVFRPADHYVVLADDVATQVRDLLAQPDRLQEIADAAHQHALDFHTYDHRVDELFEIAAATEKRTPPAPPRRSSLASLIDRDVEVQRVAQLGAPELVEGLDSRQVFDARTIAAARMAPGKMETVAVRSDDVRPITDVLRAARRYIYVQGRAAGLEDFLDTEHPHAVVERQDDLTRVDLLAESYRVLPHEIVDDTPTS